MFSRLRARRQVLVFALLGGINTLLHSAVVVAAVESGLLPPVPANVLAFAVANTFSYFANCRFTFHSHPTWARYRTFLGVSLVSLVLTIALSSLAELMGWHYLVGLGMVLLAGPVLTYVLHKRITFRRPGEAEGS